MKHIKSHHFTVFISLFVGLSFLFEKYTVTSPALLGPISLLSWVTLPLMPIQIWGVLFVAGAFGILLAPTPLIRALFLIVGTATWGLFAGASLFQSLLGPDASRTGSFLGIILVALVFRFVISIRDVVRDFRQKKDAT